MRISDWSSDVCSSDLHHLGGGLEPDAAALAQRIGGAALPVHGVRLVDLTEPSRKDSLMTAEREFTTGRRSTAPRTASDRSEERRVGKEGVSTGRSRWSPDL